MIKPIRKKSKFVIGAFYTENTPYEEVCNKYLLNSLRSFSLTYDLTYFIYVRPNFGSWNRNVAEKPKVILEMLDVMSKSPTLKNLPLVFLDADATIEKYPSLFDELPEDIDISYHNLEWKTWYKYKNSNVKELLTGTMFFRNNDRVKNLLTNWYEDAIITKEWEQKVLEKIIGQHSVKVYNLPIEYIYINSLPNGQEPHVKCDPVILHHQVSRKLKRIIK